MILKVPKKYEYKCYDDANTNTFTALYYNAPYITSGDDKGIIHLIDTSNTPNFQIENKEYCYQSFKEDTAITSVVLTSSFD